MVSRMITGISGGSCLYFLSQHISFAKLILALIAHQHISLLFRKIIITVAPCWHCGLVAHCDTYPAQSKSQQKADEEEK